MNLKLPDGHSAKYADGYPDKVEFNEKLSDILENTNEAQKRIIIDYLVGAFGILVNEDDMDRILSQATMYAYGYYVGS